MSWGLTAEVPVRFWLHVIPSLSPYLSTGSQIQYEDKGHNYRYHKKGWTAAFGAISLGWQERDYSRLRGDHERTVRDGYVNREVIPPLQSMKGEAVHDGSVRRTLLSLSTWSILSQKLIRAVKPTTPAFVCIMAKCFLFFPWWVLLL